MLDPSWMLTKAIIDMVVLLIFIIFAHFLQHIQEQQAATEATLEVLVTLRYPSHSPLQEVMRVWLSEIQKATA